MKKSSHDRPGALTRRTLLHGTGVALASGSLACGSDGEPTPPAPGPDTFVHGVASGDPLPDAVMLWTRVTPGKAGPIDVTWELGADPALAQIKAMGTFNTSAERDHTVKVEARGLMPATTYYYRFRTSSGTSPIGRTRTAPTGAVARARFGVASCSSFAQGYFHAYRALARRLDLDAIIHLGDYIYESGPGQFGMDRVLEPPTELFTLADYRTRHAQYKRDPDLQEAHRQHPFITVWDDHESANDAWKDGAQNHEPNEGSWPDRKAAAQRAYAEWMPIREQQPISKIWRKLPWGDLADIVLLDTRLWARTQSDSALVGPPPAEDPSKTLLGDDQAAWLEEQLRGPARWKVVAQQVMVANLILMPGTLINLDQWQGYPASRRRFMDFLRTSGATNTVVLTGDIHSSWANELVLDPLDPAQYDPAAGKGALAVELVTPGITSPGLPPQFMPAVDMARPHNPHVRWFDLLRQGYMVLDVNHERTQAAWYLYADIKQPAAPPETFGAAWSVKSGSTRLEQDSAAADPPATAPAAAP